MISRQQIKDICERYQLTPNHSLGQHFLLDQTVVDEAVAASQMDFEESVLEIGPGIGVLTEVLLENAKRLVAVERDKKLVGFLKAKFLPNSRLELIEDDILAIRPEKIFSEPYRIVANIPYNITSPILEKFLTAVHKPKSLTLLVQREVAERICAKPGEMSVLSVSVQLYGQARIIRRVGREAFWPSPKVDSALLHIDVDSKSDLSNKMAGLSDKEFWRCVKIGFSSRRKQLHNTLSAGLRLPAEQTVALLKELGFAVTVRAQELSIEQWVALAKKVKSYSN